MSRKTWVTTHFSGIFPLFPFFLRKHMQTEHTFSLPVSFVSFWLSYYYNIMFFKQHFSYIYECGTSTNKGLSYLYQDSAAFCSWKIFFCLLSRCKKLHFLFFFCNSFIKYNNLLKVTMRSKFVKHVYIFLKFFYQHYMWKCLIQCLFKPANRALDWNLLERNISRIPGPSYIFFFSRSRKFRPVSPWRVFGKPLSQSRTLHVQLEPRFLTCHHHKTPLH